MSKPVIKFCLNGQWIEENSVISDMTVLRYLRTRKALVGTKEGCGSGDCGVCSVLLGEYTPDQGSNDNQQQGRWHYKAINSCITFITQLDGKSLITVEALADGRQRHPAQQAMVDYHGSQCGFCTPGIVMSLAALHEYQQLHNQSKPADHHQIIDALSGNLCRCTGYRPIIEAASHMNQYLNNTHDEGHVGIWQPERSVPAAVSTAGRDPESKSPLSLEVEADVATSQTIGQSWSPKTEEELSVLLAKYPTARIVAGATDIALEVTQMNRRIPQLIAINNINSLQKIEIEKDFLLIGAGVTYSQMEATLHEHFPEFGQLLNRFASRQVRNQATMAGNIANASPIGDTPPVLLALAASIELVSHEGCRWLPLSEFFLAYKKTLQQPGEYIRRIKIPRLKNNQILKVYKISKRLEDDISAVLVALKLTLKTGSDKQIVEAASTGFGGMAGIPKSAIHLEQALLNCDVASAAFAQAAQALDQDFTPMTDVRASSEYRMQTAKNLIIKCAFELSNPSAVTRIEALASSALTAVQVGGAACGN